MPGTNLLVSAVVPYATVPFERSAEKRGELDGDWRLGRGHTEPVGLPEKVADWVIRRPVRSPLLADTTAPSSSW